MSAVKATAPIFILLLGAYFSVMAFAEYADCRAFSAANNAAATEISEASLRIVAPLAAAALVPPPWSCRGFSPGDGSFGNWSLI